MCFFGIEVHSKIGSAIYGFHMIAEIELKSMSVIVVAVIAGKWFPYDRHGH